MDHLSIRKDDDYCEMMGTVMFLVSHRAFFGAEQRLQYGIVNYSYVLSLLI